MLYISVNSSDVGATQYCKDTIVHLSISFQYQEERGYGAGWTTEELY